MKKALLAGTFDPPTLGHLDLIERAAALSNKLYVAVAINSQKEKSASFSQEERKEMLRQITRTLPSVEVIGFSGLLVDLTKKLGISHLVRGLRGVADWEQEEQMAHINRTLANIETIFIMHDSKYTFISSTLIRELASHKMRLNAFVPAALEETIFSRLSSR